MDDFVLEENDLLPKWKIILYWDICCFPLVGFAAAVLVAMFEIFYDVKRLPGLMNKDFD